MKNSNNFNIPILLLAFNRPAFTQIVFEKIREIKPEKLYVSVDGPRNSNINEEKLTNEVIKVTKSVTWDCEAKYYINEENKGCKLNVYDSISWVLQNEEYVIILEDDIVPALSFFNYARELLLRYKDENRVAMISGNNYTPIKSIRNDYLFSRYGHIWGWATWRRVWNEFDINVPELQPSLNDNLDNLYFINNKEKRYYLNYYNTCLKKIISNTQNAWGPLFMFYRHYNNYLSIVPKVNLASNIGVISSRTGKSFSKNNNYWESEENYSIINHPDNTELNLEYEQHHFNLHINRKDKLNIRIFRKFKKYF